MPEIIIYTKATCGFCHSAKRLLKQKGVDFQEIAVDFDRAIWEKMVNESGGRTVPQIRINGKWVGGFTDLYALDRSGELDKLLF